uniref:Uncharacterized protein n=1 Tax=Megaselia scalaris TaxID=36166 RepID=T1GKY4_MEGSC
MSGNSLSSNENKKALAEFDTFVQESLESRNLELKKSVFLRIYDYFARVLRTNCQSNDLQIQISKYLESWKTLLDEINRRIYSLDLENLGILVAEGFKICSLFILGYCFKIPAILSISTNYFQDQIIDVDTSILIKITKSFIEIAEVLTNTTLDLKLLADSWNFIIKLIGDYKQSLSQDISEIGRRIVKKFCTEISKTFTQIDDLKKAQIKQKLSIFFINSMYTLFQNSEKIQANEWSQILELYQNFLKSRRNLKADEKSNEYFRKIYKQVYQNEKLLENLNNYDLEIILETLLNLSEEPPQYSFNILIEKNIFDSVIKNISESDLALQNVDIFMKIVETLTILRISQNSNVQFLKTFDEKMTFGILQTESIYKFITTRKIFNELDSNSE